MGLYKGNEIMQRKTIDLMKNLKKFGNHSELHNTKWAKSWVLINRNGANTKDVSNLFLFASSISLQDGLELRLGI
jgi:hypothetical protein